MVLNDAISDELLSDLRVYGACITQAFRRVDPVEYRRKPMLNMLQTLALSLFQSVTSNPDATWSELSEEERQDATQWAIDALSALRNMAERVDDEAAELFIQAVQESGD